MKSKKLLGLISAGILGVSNLVYTSRADDSLQWGVSFGNAQGSSLFTTHNDYGEEGYDSDDHALANAPQNNNSQWIKLYSDSYDILDVDNRNNLSSTAFNLGMGGVSTGGSIEGVIDLTYNAVGGWDPSKVGGIFTGTILAAYNSTHQDIQISQVIDGSATSGSLGSYAIENVGNGDRFFTGTFTPGVVPEPSTFALFGVGAGLVGVSAYLNRRRKTNSIEDFLAQKR